MKLIGAIFLISSVSYAAASNVPKIIRSNNSIYAKVLAKGVEEYHGPNGVTFMHKDNDDIVIKAKGSSDTAKISKCTGCIVIQRRDNVIVFSKDLAARIMKEKAQRH